MKKTVVATLTCLGLGTAMATAADLPVKAPIIPPPACANFGGVYVGGYISSVQFTQHVVDADGYINDTRQFVGDPPRATGFSTSNDNWGGGAQIGWNWQRHCSIWGIVADGTWTNLKTDVPFFPNFRQPGLTQDVGATTRLDWFGTLRTKTGIIVDNTMLYVTGGLAWARFRTSAHDIETQVTATGQTFANGTINSSVDFSDTKWGWTAGFGAEYAFTPNVSIFTEALYLSFPSRTYNVVETGSTTGAFAFNCPAPSRTCGFQTGEQVITAKVGLNFRWWDSPVVARY
jgi:outer membrane immunogenic protein